MAKKAVKRQIAKNKVPKWIYWTPRILSMIFVLFLALFSLDVFDSCTSFFNCALGLFMHNIPALILLIVLIISWKYEIVGGIAFILAGLLYIVAIITNVFRAEFEWFMLSWIIQISGIAFFIGIMFLIGWKKKRK
jgi:hypothetical protein